MSLGTAEKPCRGSKLEERWVDSETGIPVPLQIKVRPLTRQIGIIRAPFGTLVERRVIEIEADAESRS